MRRPKATVVVVDDDPIVLEQARSALEPEGYRVVTRGRAIGCIALTLQDEPDLLLMDVGLPGIEGDTLVKMLMAASPKRRTRVVLYSSMRESELRRRVQDSGADGYLRKTKDPKILVKEVTAWLSVRPRDTGNGAPREPTSLSPTPTSYRAAWARPQILFVDDDMMVLSSYRRLIQRENMDAEFALSGSQALKWILSSEPPDVVVCDLMMPDPDGDAVLARAMEVNPRWAERFIFAGGFKDTAHKLRLSARSTVLSEPVDPDQLLGAIRKSLGLIRSPEFAAIAGR